MWKLEIMHLQKLLAFVEMIISIQKMPTRNFNTIFAVKNFHIYNWYFVILITGIINNQKIQDIQPLTPKEIQW